VVHADDPDTGHHAGERHHAGPGGADLLARLTGEVDAAVPGLPGPRRRVEAAHHRGRAGERPGPAGDGEGARGDGGGVRPYGRGLHQHREQQGSDDRWQT
jgi:hypothetical protein